MNTVQNMREEVKQFIDSADEKVVEKVYAMLVRRSALNRTLEDGPEVNQGEDWWATLPDEVKADVETALKEADLGRVVPHEEIRERYQKWLAK